MVSQITGGFTVSSPTFSANIKENLDDPALVPLVEEFIDFW